MSVTHLAVVSIPVSDQERSKRFSSEVLGFDVVADTPFVDNQRWVQLRPPKGEASITLVTWFPDMPAGSVSGLVLECDDIDATFADLNGHGLEFTSPITKEFWGTFATFDDPDGNSWILSRSAASAAASAT
jgi:catechol 2,3-dioxygenase-like lactoylglutathione lyase family enzyme